MREIRFRGRGNSGVWYYGLLGKHNNAWFILGTGPYLDSFSYINSETIGQCVGLTDMQGEKLYWWEGDLLDDGSKIVEVIYEQGAFYARWIEHHDHKTLLNDWRKQADNVRKIGNIHDSRELLTEEE